MFGYVKPFIPNLRIKDYELYKSVYCGLCRAMKKRTGNLSRFTLSYDMTFFALVRLALSETELSIRKRRCAVHPLKKRPMMDENPALTYTAYASALLAGYKIDDTRADEKGLKKLGASLATPYGNRLKKRARRAEYEIEAIVRDGMAEISRLEKEQCPIPDQIADAFGMLLGELLSAGFDGSKAMIAKEIGLHTGRFVYLIDAANDYPEDRKKGSYNPFLFAFEAAEELEAFRKTTLRGMLTMDADKILHAVDLIEFENRSMLRSCIENIITDGLESALSLTVGKEVPYGK